MWITCSAHNQLCCHYLTLSTVDHVNIDIENDKHDQHDQHDRISSLLLAAGVISTPALRWGMTSFYSSSPIRLVLLIVIEEISTHTSLRVKTPLESIHTKNCAWAGNRTRATESIGHLASPPKHHDRQKMNLNISSGTELLSARIGRINDVDNVFRS